MNRSSNRIGLGAIVPGAWRALQWRLLLLWVAGLLLPTVIITLPVWQALSSQLDFSVHAGEWARRFDAVAVGDILSAMRKSFGLIGASGFVATAIALLLSPLLTGFSIAAIRAPRRLGFGELVHGGMSEYWKLFRLLLLAIVPLGIAIGLGAVAIGMAGKHADTAILASGVERAGRIALVFALVLFVVAHATVEAARAQFAVDPNLRSALRAWWRGVKLVARRPLSMLGVYVVIAAIGLAVAAAFGVWRIGVPHASFVGLLFAFLLTQAIAMTIGWMRSARLFAYAEIIRRG